ncbi:uncharacterized protein N7506_001814 [Penicillium brevicompactum]|uniref:uncharacterized protein n=1 Tax=Penicillium brevicompactum TaxID=5074 RepID=UPI002540D527|nr:uncharacterized protein N7506_001814 [Penicillium brevicompactum]KAJ5348561.1 hypothetical protein N7506_001814 [Penicillium brevicompactum]
MPPTEIKTDALQEFNELASWVHRNAKMEPEKGKENKLVCTDKAREAKVRPLLEKLGYANIPGHLASLQRIFGKALIEKPNDDRSVLFFPLSIGSGPESIGSGNMHVAGETLKPGTYIQLTETLELNEQLDCLIVLLP